MVRKKYNILKITFGAITFSITLAIFTDMFFEKFIIYDNDLFSNTGKIKRLIESDSKKEIPIFGSSIARMSYYMDSLDFESFNYGMQGMVFEHLEPLMEIELEKDKKSPIIFDYHHLAFLSHNAMPVQISNYVPFIENEKIQTLLEKKKLSKDYLKVKGLRFYGCYMDYLKEYIRFRKKTSITLSKGGVYSPTQSEELFERFIEKRAQSIQKRNSLEQRKIEVPELFSKIDSLELDRLNSLLRFKENKSEVDRFENLLEKHRDRVFILVYSPQHYSKLDGIDNYDSMIWFLEKLKERHENLRVLNYSYLDYPNNYFRDTGHLSIEGAKFFSGNLNTDIQEILSEISY